MRFDRVAFVRNEVVGWRDTHIFVSGSKATVVFPGCTFDTPDRSEAILVDFADGESPKVVRNETRFGVRAKHVYERLVANESAEFYWDFNHAKSDLFAMFVVVPLFIGCATACLVC
jgi:hypothetical protein